MRSAPCPDNEILMTIPILAALLGASASLKVGDKEVGWVTSAAETTQGRLGLGYLRRAHWREGERLTTPAGDAVVRRVVVHEPD